MHTNFNCKAAEVTEVIEKVNSKKSSGNLIIDGHDELKKHSH